jgi:phospholipid/cholesterol/gamma-HCH transport system substrate-binding protein
MTNLHNTLRRARLILAALLVLSLAAGITVAVRGAQRINRTVITAYFDNSNGIFVGDQVRILGIPVGKIDAIQPEPRRTKITFWVDDRYKIPADAKAVILSPSLVTARAIQLTPVYRGGPQLPQRAVIGQDRTAVPVEWDDFRQQLQKLTEALQPTQPGGVSTLGAFINTSADNLRGQGSTIRQTIIELSQLFSALGDHSQDIFGTVKNLALLANTLHDSTDVMQQLNTNLAAVSSLIANDPNEVGDAVTALNAAARDVTGFVNDNREALGTTSDKLASVSGALTASLGDIKQALHLGPTTYANFLNVYQPAQGAITGVLALNNFANPITFLCGAIQAASRLGNEQSAKLCVQYLAPIIKNRQYNFPPLGFNPFVGAQARPNEVTYSEDWMRPDYVPPPASPPGDEVAAEPLPAEAPDPAPPAAPATATDPAAGLPGLMIPPGAGS